MKEIVRNLTFFVSLCLVFSMLTGCAGTGANVANTNTSKSASNSNETKNSKSSEYPPLASGLAEADFELLDGSKFKVSEKKGKVLLLNIWGTWCGPCREEMPHLVEMQNKYAAQGLEIIGLNIGDGSGTPESIEQIKAFVEKMKLNYTIARSPNASTIQFYQISKQQVVPQTLLVDREGHLRGVFVGGGQRVIDSMKNTLDKTMAES
ncbi:MAG TPA: TlpA disulfide reductase family protein [Pyrinomonadaceae bacterium]|nr:TlpA family protein disulfide reductase [Acidobacteriota bacterium]HQZ96375.1 TlpA disulfide reductase family protein [Pyrinomonadaceae bacterium]